MPPFYNREPWNLVIAVGAFAAGLLAIAVLTTLWLLLVPVALVAFFILKNLLVRTVALRSKGYYAGRRIRDTWVYEEMQGESCVSLTLPVENTEPGHYELFFPTELQWRESVPQWAKNRRVEIANRIAEGWKASDVHLP